MVFLIFSLVSMSVFFQNYGKTILRTTLARYFLSLQDELLSLMVMRIKFITGLLLLLPLLGVSQGEFNKWYFGVNAGIDFNATPPSALPAGSMNTMHASFSVADSTGSLLFYSQGQSVWNRNHQVMPNGSGLFGGQSNQQVFTMKKPGTENLYYLFSIFMNLYPPGYGLYYSLIDMNLNGGLGDVVTGYKNIPVSGVVGAISGIHRTRHLSYKDAWIVVKTTLL